MRGLYFSSVLVLLSVMAMSACGKKTNMDDLNNTEWQTQCSAKGTSTTRVGFTDGKMTVTQLQYSKPGCKELEKSQIETFDSTIGEDVPGVISGQENVKELNLKIQSVQMAYASDSSVSNANTNYMCGIQNWSKGGARDVLAEAPADRKVKIKTKETVMKKEKHKKADGTEEEVEVPTEVEKETETEFYAESCPAFSPNYMTQRMGEGDKIRKIKAGDELFSVIKVEFLSDDKGRLYLGSPSDRSEDGSTAELRPATLLDSVFQRVK